MKLFVWNDALRDYTAGLAFGIGDTLEEVLSEFPPYISEQLGVPDEVIILSEITEPYVKFIYGGG